MSNSNQLKNALLGNAAFSTINGIALLFFHEKIAAIMHIGIPEILLVIGVGLLLFAGGIFMITRQNPINTKRVQFITLQDWLWVIGSVIILALQLFGLSQTGYLLILFVAIIVAIFAVLQRKYLVKS